MTARLETRPRHFLKPAGLTQPALINTLLQRGVGGKRDLRNRFNGFSRAVETVETVSVSSQASHTPLNQGVNERYRCHDLLLTHG
jgi:hypothetical protein